MSRKGASGIVQRSGDSALRKKAHKNLSDIGNLKADFQARKTEVSRLTDIVGIEKEKLKKAKQVLDKTCEELYECEEKIDSDPLPEGAQPVARIHHRDTLRMVRDC